jgi:hypothetical protein
MCERDMGQISPRFQREFGPPLKRLFAANIQILFGPPTALTRGENFAKFHVLLNYKLVGETGTAAVGSREKIKVPVRLLNCVEV